MTACANRTGHNGTLQDKGPEMMVFNCYVLNEMSGFRCISNYDTDVIVFPDFAFEDWLGSK